MSTQQQAGRGACDVPERPSTGVTVLHVDDEPGFPTMLADFARLEEDEVVVVSATDAVEALDRLEARATDFDCIVTDHEMPGMGGLEFAREVRRRGIELPLIMFSTSALDPRSAETVEPPGITGWIRKGGHEQYRELIHLLQQAAGIAARGVPSRESDGPAPFSHRASTRLPARAFDQTDTNVRSDDDQLRTDHQPRIECKQDDHR